jgi:hypothetical protein
VIIVKLRLNATLATTLADYVNPYIPKGFPNLIPKGSIVEVLSKREDPYFKSGVVYFVFCPEVEQSGLLDKTELDFTQVIH